MSLIEGVGDEVTILVTIIVAMTTIVVAWFSTSVQEHQSSWQDDIPGSVVDPDPLSQESNSSADDGGEVHEAGTDTIDSEIAAAPDQTRDTYDAGATVLPQTDEPSSVENVGSCHSTEEDNSPTVEERCNVVKGDTASASQSSSFESIEAAFVTKKTPDSNATSTVIRSPDSPDVSDSTDGNFEKGRPSDDAVHELGVNNKEEQGVRRRHVPSTEATVNKVAERTTSSATSIEESSQSEGATQAETNSTNSSGQSGGATQAGARRRSQTPQHTRDQIASGVIAIKLRFLDETERIVSTNMDDTLGNFRRETFTAEIQSGKMVRFISNGQVLHDDSRTLASYGIANNQVVICQISSASAQRGNQSHDSNSHQGTAGEPTDDFDLGRYMVPLFACVLAFVWYLRFQYRYMFNATSTLSLTAVTAVFILALLAVWRS